MISWLVIGILIVIALIALKMNHLRHKIWIIVIIFIALFLYTSANFIYKQHQLEFNTAEGVFDASKIYIGWLSNGFQNLKALTGQIIKMDWTSSTNNKTLEKNLNIK